MFDSSLSNPVMPIESHIFLTNTALVLTLINRNGEIRMREIAQRIGITEIAVQGIVDHLITEEYLVVNSSNGRNLYHVNRDRVLGSPFNDCPLGSFLQLCETQD